MRVGRIWRLWVIAVLWATTSAGFGRGAYAQQPPAAREEETFRFRFVGPRAGNRVAAVAGVPGDPSTYYAGAASGGGGSLETSRGLGGTCSTAGRLLSKTAARGSVWPA